MLSLVLQCCLPDQWMDRGVTRVQGWWDLESPPPHFGSRIGCPLRARDCGHLPTSSPFIVVFYLLTPRRMRCFAVCSGLSLRRNPVAVGCCTFVESLPPYYCPRLTDHTFTALRVGCYRSCTPRWIYSPGRIPTTTTFANTYIHTRGVLGLAFGGFLHFLLLTSLRRPYRVRG